MHEISQLVLETAAGTVATLLGLWKQCRAARRRRELAGTPWRVPSLTAIGDQLDAIDALIEAHTEPAERLRREDDAYRAAIRQSLLDIHDLSALTRKPRAATDHARLWFLSVQYHSGHSILRGRDWRLPLTGHR